MNDSKILCSIFRGSKREGMYLYVRKDTDLETLPEGLLQQFGNLTLAMTLVLTESRQLARADVKKVMSMIVEQGFYLQMPPADADADIAGKVPGRHDDLPDANDNAGRN